LKFLQIPEACRMDRFSTVIRTGAIKPTRIAPKEKTDAVCSDDLPYTFMWRFDLCGHDVLVQPEMERGRSPLVSIPPFGRGFSRYRYDHQAIPQHGCVPAEPASVSPGQIIVAPPHPSVSTSGYPVIQGLRCEVEWKVRLFRVSQ
jgi:hypothetical protein